MKTVFLLIVGGIVGAVSVAAAGIFLFKDAILGLPDLEDDGGPKEPDEVL